MSIWDIYLDLDAMEARRRYKKALNEKKPGKKSVEKSGKQSGKQSGKKPAKKGGQKVSAKKKSRLPLIILVSVLSVVLICLIIFISMLLFGWSSNALTRAVNRSKAEGLFEKYILQETATKVNLPKVRKDISSPEEQGYYNEIVEVFSADPGIIAMWFEYLRMDEWDFAMAKEDIELEIESSDTDMLLALCAKHGYPEFQEEYGYLLDDEPVEEEEVEEEPIPEEEVVEEEPPAPEVTEAPEEVVPEPVEEVVIPEEVEVPEPEEEVIEEVSENEYIEEVPEDMTENEDLFEETDEDGEYAEEEMTVE
ncbi:MAG: hypothetical protein IJU93_06950 [Lachnospiraceae bacterium]|nr:hypothetical protein [Lachnospiraceae bacterium]